MRKVYKYGTGEKIPDGAVYLCSLKNGLMPQIDDVDRCYVWHYFLVEEEGGKKYV